MLLADAMGFSPCVSKTQEDSSSWVQTILLSPPPPSGVSVHTAVDPNAVLGSRAVERKLVRRAQG